MKNANVRRLDLAVRRVGRFVQDVFGINSISYSLWALSTLALGVVILRDKRQLHSSLSDLTVRTTLRAISGC